MSDRPKMLYCKLENMRLHALEAPSSKEDVSGYYTYSSDVFRSADSDDMRVLKIVLKFQPDNGKFYELDVEAKALFQFVNGTPEEATIDYLREIGLHEALAVARSLVEGVSSGFVHGSFLFPDLQVLEELGEDAQEIDLSSAEFA